MSVLVVYAFALCCLFSLHTFIRLAHNWAVELTFTFYDQSIKGPKKTRNNKKKKKRKSC